MLAARQHNTGMNMTRETVNAEVREGPAVTFEYDFGDTIEDANKIFGAEVVWAFAKRALVIAAQGYARGLLKSEKTVEEIQAAFETWKPGAPRAKADPVEKAREQWSKMSAEDRANLLREFAGEAAPAPEARTARKHRDAA